MTTRKESHYSTSNLLRPALLLLLCLTLSGCAGMFPQKLQPLAQSVVCPEYPEPPENLMVQPPTMDLLPDALKQPSN